METIKQQKASKVIQMEMANILREDANLYGGLITVIKVNVTKDLSLARVNISIFAVKDKQEVLKKIKSNTKDIRYRIGNLLKNQMRIIPNLEFYLDESFDKVQRIEELLKH